MAQSVADFLVERLGEWGMRRIYGYPGGVNAITTALRRDPEVPRFLRTSASIRPRP